VTVLGGEPALVNELAPVRASGPRWPAVLTSRGQSSSTLDPAFALQQLPDLVNVHADSLRALAEAAHVRLRPALESASGWITLHAFVPEPHAYRSLGSSAALLGETFLAQLRERRRRLFRRYVPWTEVSEFGDTLLIQLALVGRGSLLVSAARPQPLEHGGFHLAPWPGGRPPIAEDRRAPSRAYRKLEEAFAWMDAAPSAGEACVDLGAAPGGWTWVALQRGAAVVAVDRALVERPAAGHPRLASLIGDAFSYRPAQPVDWLLCDVIGRPQRTLDLCRTWMEAGWCRRLVATIKLKAREDDDQIAEARRRLARTGWPYLRLKHLSQQHNEVAILARRD
jgi:23S rRNA (cytidine2498-2'-O)-methyltransferase